MSDHRPIDTDGTDRNPYEPPKSRLYDEQPSSTNETELASRWLRFAGAFVDGLIQFTIVFPLMYYTGSLDRAMAGVPTLSDTLVMPFVGLLIFVLLNGYLLANYGQSIGKRLLKTRIVSVGTGEILPLWKIIALRMLPLYIVGLIPILAQIGGLADALFIFGRDRRCIHDHIAGTKVVVAG